MVKMTKNVAMWALLLFIGIIGYTYLSANGQLSMLSAGGATLSISEVKIESTNPNFANKNILATVLVNGMGESLVGETQTQTVSSLLHGSSDSNTRLLTSTQSLDVKYNLDKAQAIYPLTYTGYTFPEYRVASVAGVKTRDWLNRESTHDGSECLDMVGWGSDSTLLYESNCKLLGGIPLRCGIDPVYKRQCYAVINEPNGQLRTLSASSEEYSITITATSGGKVESVKINSASQPLGKTADGVMIVQFISGEYSGNHVLPSESGVSVYWNPVGGSKVIDKVSTSSLQALPSTSTAWGNPTVLLDLQNQVLIANGNLNILRSKTPATTNWNNAKVDLSAVTIDNTASPTFYPKLRMYISAIWLGIRIPATKPVLVSATPASPLTLNGGDFKDVSISIRNDGEDGSVKLTGTCTNGARVEGSNQNIPITKGSTNYGTLRVFAPTTEGISVCTFISTDANDPSITSSLTYSINVNPVCKTTCGTNAHVDVSACKCICDLSQPTDSNTRLVYLSDGGCKIEQIPPPPDSCGRDGCGANENRLNCPQDCGQAETKCIDGTTAVPSTCQLKDGVTTGSKCWQDGTGIARLDYLPDSCPPNIRPKDDWTPYIIAGGALAVIVGGGWLVVSRKKRKH